MIGLWLVAARYAFKGIVPTGSGRRSGFGSVSVVAAA
jgi:hypothetical protein